MSLEIVKVEAPKELAAEQVNTVKEAFTPHIEAMGELEPRYKALTDVKLVEPTAEQVKEARTVRLALVKTRTGTAKTHKALKADALVYSRYVDGMKKAQEVACNERESRLMEIEKHFENIEKERIEKLYTIRAAELLDYETPEAAIPSTIGEMEEEVWKNYIAGIREGYYQRKEAEKKAKEEAEAKAKAEAEEQERIRLENERLKAEAAEREKKAAEERAERERIEQERLAKEKAEREAREKEEAERRAREEAARKAQEEEARKERERLENIQRQKEAQLQAEREERERLEREKAEREARERAEREAEEKRQADTKHRLGVNDSVIAALIENGVPAAVANRLVDVMANGEIPHVTVNY